MPLKPDDTILNGKYRIVRLIAKGGMARVWLAEELTFGGRLVALKEPRDDLLPDLAQEVRLRYQREVQVCAALDKARVQNIVRAHTADPYGNTVLLAMEYMPGGDLAALMKEHPDGLPVEQAVKIALDLLAALEGVHAHEMEIVHRDVKPSNVLFDEQGRAHLADFGLAQLAGMSGRSQLAGGQHPGTPIYMAPEQARGSDVLLPAADLYSVGCVLFEMLTGKRYKRVRPGTLPSTLRVGMPRWLDEVVAKALAEDPWERWHDAAEMAAAIGEAEERARAQAAGEARRREEAEQARAQVADEARRREEERAQIWQAIDAGDTGGARLLLRQALTSPTAETYYLASLVASNDEQRIDFLEKALALNPHYRSAMEAMGRRQAEPNGETPASASSVLTPTVAFSWARFDRRRLIGPAVLGTLIGGGVSAVLRIHERLNSSWMLTPLFALAGIYSIILIISYARRPLQRSSLHYYQFEILTFWLTVTLASVAGILALNECLPALLVFLFFWAVMAVLGNLAIWLARRMALRKA